MPLDQDVQLAAALLQATGLILPVVFIALRPYYADELNNSDNVIRRKGRPDETEVEKRVHDNTPTVVHAGLYAVGLFAVSTLLSSARLALATNDLLIRGAVLTLWVGIVMLVLVFALIRTEFLSYEYIK